MGILVSGLWEQHLSVAHELVSAGIPVFAAPPSSTGAQTEFELPANRLWMSASDSNIDDWRPGWALGMVTGCGFDAVDVDVQHGGSVDAEQALLMKLGIPILAQVSTPSGGAHFYVPTCGISSSMNRARGVDFRGGLEGRHGFVYLPGTRRRRRTRKTYSWTQTPRLDALGGLQSVAGQLRCYLSRQLTDDTWRTNL